MSNIAGKYILKINSKKWPLKGNPTFFLGGSVQEEIEDVMDERIATSEVPKNPYIEGSVANFNDVDASELQQLKGATVLLQDPNGNNYCFRDCSCIGNVSNDGSGAWSFRIVGSGKADKI